MTVTPEIVLRLSTREAHAILTGVRKARAKALKQIDPTFVPGPGRLNVSISRVQMYGRLEDEIYRRLYSHTRCFVFEEDLQPFTSVYNPMPRYVPAGECP